MPVPGDTVRFSMEKIGGQYTVTGLRAARELRVRYFGLATEAGLICVKYAIPRKGILASGYAE